MSNLILYKDVEEILLDTKVEDKLVVLSNLLFDCYNELYNEDILWNKVQVSKLKLKEDFNELEDTYSFHKESFVYKVLDSAHNILLVSNTLIQHKRK